MTRGNWFSWARSINGERTHRLQLPHPADLALAFLVREPLPSIATGTSLDGAVVPQGETLVVTSEMDDGGCCSGTASRTTGSTSRSARER